MWRVMVVDPHYEKAPEAYICRLFDAGGEQVPSHGVVGIERQKLSKR